MVFVKKKKGNHPNDFYIIPLTKFVREKNRAKFGKFSEKQGRGGIRVSG